MAEMTSMNEELRKRIHAERAFPSPPIVTARLIELGDNPEASLNEIIEVLGTDPTLAARLLRLANSPLYAGRRRTENLRQAVVVLGLDAVLTASLSLTLINDRSREAGMSPAFRKRRWMRSVHAAACAQHLAEFVAGVDPADAFLAALLQDIGVNVVARIEPAAYEELGDGGTHDQVMAAEVASLGCDHAVIGAELLSSWLLPERIVDAVLHSHELGAEEQSNLSAVASISGLVADGISGQGDALRKASRAADELLGVDESTFGLAVEHLMVALPDLAQILEADSPDPNVLAELAEELIVMRQMKSQTATAALHDQLASLTVVAQELKAETRLDPLTGLANRRELDEVLEREFALSRTQSFPLSVLFGDLDDFKKVNDRFGHKVGDELLVQTSRRISAGVRDGDIVGRFGGEEFVVVLPGADEEGSEVVAKRLVRQFRTRGFNLDAELSIPQTISIGVATFDIGSPFASVVDLLQAADEALYEAKRRGKDQWRRGRATELVAATNLTASAIDR